MKNEVIITAKTVDEAMAQARRDYSSSENELAFEILEMPKKGFLGIGAGKWGDMKGIEINFVEE